MNKNCRQIVMISKDYCNLHAIRNCFTTTDVVSMYSFGILLENPGHIAIFFCLSVNCCLLVLLLLAIVFVCENGWYRNFLWKLQLQ